MEFIPRHEAVSQAMLDVLESINAVYEQEGIELPARQFTAVGEVPHDCEQLVVSFLQMYSGSPGDQAEAVSRCNDPNTIVLQVQLVRSIPNKVTRAASGTPPEMMNESTAKLTADASLLLEGCMASKPADFLGALADVSITDPAGNYQAIQVNLVTSFP